MPSTTSENCHITSGCSGLPKFRQLTSATGARADARDVARRLEHGEPAAGARVEAAEAALAVGGERERRGRCPSAGGRRRRAPGPTTVLRNSWWSYWRYTHDLSAIVGVAEQREQLAREVGAGGERGERARAPGRRRASASWPAGRASGRSYTGPSPRLVDRDVGDGARRRQRCPSGRRRAVAASNSPSYTRNRRCR